MKMKYKLILIISLIIILGCDLRTSQLYFEEAFKLENEEKYEEAILLLNKAIEKKPAFLGAYINRGANKSALGKQKEAIKDYEKVIKIAPDNVFAIFNKANNLKRLKEYEEAIIFYNKAIELKGKKELGDESFWLGIKYFSQQYYGQSVTTKDFQLAMEAATNTPLADFFNTWVY